MDQLDHLGAVNGPGPLRGCALQQLLNCIIRSFLILKIHNGAVRVCLGFKQRPGSVSSSVCARCFPVVSLILPYPLTSTSMRTTMLMLLGLLVSSRMHSLLHCYHIFQAGLCPVYGITPVHYSSVILLLERCCTAKPNGLKVFHIPNSLSCCKLDLV